MDFSGQLNNIEGNALDLRELCIHMKEVGMVHIAEKIETVIDNILCNTVYIRAHSSTVRVPKV